MKLIDNKPQYKRYLAMVGETNAAGSYLTDYIENIEMPDGILTEEDLGNIARGALDAKIEFVASENSAKSGRKQALPKSLEETEIPYLMKAVFHITSIQTAETLSDKGIILGIYNEHTGVYDTSIHTIHSKIRQMGCYKLSTNTVNNIFDSLASSSPVIPQTADPRLCLVGNGIYDRATRKLLPYTPDYVCLSKIATNYVENAPLPVIRMHDGKFWDVESWMRDLVIYDDEYELLWQVISDTTQPNVCRNKSVWFYSAKGNNGKGTLGLLIKNLVGQGNYSSLSLADFSKEFAKETLLTSNVNIADENDVSGYIDSAKDFKLAVTGDDIFVNRKYEKGVSFKFKGTNIQMFNGLPKTKDKTGSLYRRIILLPFLKSFTDNGERTYIKNEYMYRQDVLEYVLFKALNTEFTEFTVPESAKELITQYREDNNPVEMFWNEFKNEFTWDLLPNDFLYDLFKKWFRETNPSGTVINKNTMLKDLGDVLDTEHEKIWDNKMNRRSSNVRRGSRMDKQEPLILQYELDNWMNKNCSSNRPEKVLAIDLKDKYRGLVRIGS